MKRTTGSVLMLLLVILPWALAQKKNKPWTEWNLNEAQKVLNDSAWGQTQVEYNTSEMFYSTTNQGPGAGTSRAQGAFNQATPINFHIRFLSAKPVRQALARSILLQQGKGNKQLEARFVAFADRRLDPYIVVSVDWDSKDARLSGPAMQVFTSAIANVLKNNTYLERKDGKRSFLLDYNPPTGDGLGAKFIFAREFEGKPFIDADSGEVRFYSELGSVKLNMRFKVADFIYEGALEY
jgi:hypothetical protein